jgi:transmembrane sensor
MRDLHDKLDELRDEFHPEWDEDDTERALAGVPERRTRRRRTKVAASVAALALLGSVAVLVASMWGGFSQAPGGSDQIAQLPHGVPGQTTSEAFMLSDGSTVSPGARSMVRLVENSAGLSKVALEQGEARFLINGAPERRFYVLAKDVQIEMVGTKFDVRRSGESVEVFVVNGTARVKTSSGEEVVLESGEDGRFPLEKEDVGAVPIVFAPDSVAEAVEIAEAEQKTVETVESVESAASAASEQPARAASPQPKWAQLARSGDWKAASAELQKTQGPRDADGLMLAADVYRYSGNLEAAIPYLEKVVEMHAGDWRAPLAQFQKGRILMKLGRYSQAADELGKLQNMSGGGSVAEDALSREVEAWYRSGAKEMARKRAEKYLEEYPDGYRAKVVRRYGGIQSP